MLIALSDLMHYDVHVGEDTHAISDIFLDGTPPKPSHIVLETGTAVAPNQVLVPARFLEAPDTENRSVILRRSAEQLEQAPVLTEDESEGAAAGLTALAAPFAHLALVTDTGRDRSKADPEAEKIVAKKTRLSRVQGLPVRSKRAELGRVDDVIVDWDDQSAAYLVVDNGTALAGRQLMIDIARFGPLNPELGHVATDLSPEEMEHEPQVENVDEVERHWLDTARTYYRLPV